MRKIGTILHEAEYYYQKAIHSQDKEQPDTILEYFDRAIAAHPEHAMAWNEKANFLDYLGKCEDAISCYDVALKIDPQLSEAWFNKGMTLKKMGKEKEGLACIDKGIDFACGR
ncbi:MAG: tetratricopeptide repeat protein [Methanoregulaceae archaeon]|jgi:tetratricopeptide (TPR) repeat protein|nr:tetratricopeptide repeat protein [Methanoregulaceae archaeon]